MALPGVDVDLLAGRLLLIRPHLDERAWRLLLGAEAKVLGRGGIKIVAAAVGAHPDTVAQGSESWITRMPCRVGYGGPVRAGPRPARRTRHCGTRWTLWWIR
jgi:hypothetical protein